MNHDAKSIVGMLRDHLAAHDRPISFLFGAGTSCAVNISSTGFTPLIPAVAGLTSECKSAVTQLGSPESQAWELLEQECKSLSLSPNIESILSRIRYKLDALATNDTLFQLTKQQWENIDNTIRNSIVRIAAPSTIPDSLPHHLFSRWTRNTTRRQAVEVFTTNYDVLFERSFDQLRVPHFDGFVGSQFAYYSPETVENDELLPSPSWIRYWKLHGSVTWAMEKVRAERRITRGRENSTGELILPSHRKYDESRKQPYRSLMDRFSRVLARPDSLLITSGFSFSDQHINAIVLDAVEQHPRTHIIILSYLDVEEDSEVAKWATQFPNILVIGPNSGVVSGRHGKWTVSGTPDDKLQAATGGLIQPDPKVPAGFRLLAGDFNGFCSFLASMNTHRGHS